MPELPEVEVTKKRCAAILCGQRLAKVKVHPDEIVFCAAAHDELQAKLQGRRVIGCHRKGKYFWWSFEDGHALVLHLGMTGTIHVPTLPDLKLSHGIEVGQAQWPPRFVKLEVETDLGQRLAFCDARRFGRIRWQQDPLKQAPLSKLGIDPIAEDFVWEAFYAKLQRRKGVIKGLLLNQSFIAGIGNWIADEVLHHAGIAPHTPAEQLNEAQARRLFAAIREVIEHAVAVDANAQRFPEGWLFHRRWNPAPDQRNEQGHLIEFTKIAGRTTAWVPSVQS